MSVIDILSISCEIALRCMPQKRIDTKSLCVQVMVWCLQPINHYSSQCGHRFYRHMASLGHNEFTYLDRYQVANILKIFSNVFSRMKILDFLEKFRCYCFQGPIKTTPVLVQIIDLYKTGDKPWSETMLAYLTDAYMSMHHLASMTQK